MQLSDLVKQKWEKIFPFIQVNNWRGSNCLLICQQKFGSLALWHDEIAEMLQLHVLASSSSSPWNTGMSVHSLFLIYTSTPALLSAGPDLWASFMGMVVKLHLASKSIWIKLWVHHPYRVSSSTWLWLKRKACSLPFIDITVMWTENGLITQRKVQIPQLPLWYKNKQSKNDLTPESVFLVF